MVLGVMLQLGSIGASDMLNKLEELGFFQYGLPFLLIFAVVYTILTRIEVFANNKGASVIVSVAVGLLSLQFDAVPAFFQNIFPKFGIGLAVLLIALILGGAFISGEKSYKWIFFGLGAAIFAIILILSFSDFQFTGSFWWEQYGAMVIGAIVIIVAMIMITLSTKSAK